MRVYYDTEFVDDGRTIELVSIGAVREDGAEYYAETHHDPTVRGQEWSPWMAENVVPHLRGEKFRKMRYYMGLEIIEFAGPEPELWGWYSAYDHVALCQLFGSMIDLPKGWPMYTMDVRQYADHVGWPKRKRPPIPKVDEHDALADARWTREAHGWLERWSRLDPATRCVPI